MCYDAYFCKIFAYLCKNSSARRFMKKIMNEKLAITASNPVRARFYEYPRFTYPWHFHSEYEIIYVEKGEGDCLVGDSIIPYSKGDLILFGSELPHSMQSPPEDRRESGSGEKTDNGERPDNGEESGSREELGNGKEPEPKVKGVNIQFEKDFMHYSISQYSQFIPIRNLLEDACRGIKFTVARSGKIFKLLQRIPSAKGAEQIILLLSLLQMMAAGNRRKYLTTSHYTPAPSIMRNERMEKVIAYLNKHYTESVGLDEIASYTAMNPAAFCRYFKENTGKTFKEYVLDMRIGYACKLLNNSVMNVSQISAACGFESSVHFNRIFKRLTGMTPTFYREQME